MPLSAACPDCGQTYTLKDELAGKKFRCKKCNATVPVPALEPVEDDFGNLGEEDWEAGEPQELPPATRQRVSSGKSKSGKKKSKRQPYSPGGGSKIAWIVGGVVTLLAMCGGLGFLLKSLDLTKGLGLTVTWQDYTTPDGQVSMQMPGVPKRPQGLEAGQVVPGGEAWAVETRSFACAVIIEPINDFPADMSDQEFYDLVKQGIPLMLPGATNIGMTTVDGRTAIGYQANKGSITVEHKAIRLGPKTYTFTYGYRSSGDAEMRSKFFDSIKVKAP